MADDISVDRQAAARRDAFLRELERKSLDTIMVYNPTDKDYLVEWDRRFHRVPAATKDMGFGKGKMEFPRYLAEKYAREMKNIIINALEDEYRARLRNQREKVGQKFRDKFEENEAALPLAPKTNDPARIKEIYNNIILGVVREYGMDMVPAQEGEEMDTKTPEEMALESLNRPYKAEEEPGPAELAFTAEPLPTNPEKSYRNPTAKVKTAKAVNEVAK